eukprot:COSAG02_NODE_4107_length_5769_cov_7.499471_3_plen_422_part_00
MKYYATRAARPRGAGPLHPWREGVGWQRAAAMPKRGRTTPPPPPGPPGVATVAPPAKPPPSASQRPPAKRRCGQAEPKTEALLTAEDLDTGTIHWNGLLAMLTKIHGSEPATGMVEGWLAEHREGLGDENTRNVMLKKVKAHIESGNELPVCGTATVQNRVAFSKDARESQQPKGITSTARWYYSSGKWYSTNPNANKRHSKKVVAAAAARPTLTRAEPADTELCIPPLPATLDIQQQSASFGPTPVQLRRLPGLNDWCGVIANYSKVRVVAKGTEGGMSQEWVKIRWDSGAVPQEGWVKREYVKPDEVVPPRELPSTPATGMAIMSSASTTDQVSFSSSMSQRNPQQTTLREHPQDVCTGGNRIMPVVREGDVVHIVPTEEVTEARTGVVWVKVKPPSANTEGWIRRKWLRRACTDDDHC